MSTVLQNVNTVSEYTCFILLVFTMKLGGSSYYDTSLGETLPHTITLTKTGKKRETTPTGRTGTGRSVEGRQERRSKEGRRSLHSSTTHPDRSRVPVLYVPTLQHLTKTTKPLTTNPSASRGWCTGRGVVSRRGKKCRSSCQKVRSPEKEG